MNGIDHAAERALALVMELDRAEREYRAVEAQMRLLQIKRAALANRLMELRLRAMFGSAVMFVLLVASSASAQTHPCDETTTTTGKVATNTPLYAYFCQAQTAGIDAVTVYRNGTPTNLTNLELPNATPNAAGMVQYRVLVGTMPAGSHVIEVSNWNKSNITGAAQEGPRSAPFTLTVAIPTPAPAAPKVTRVTP